MYININRVPFVESITEIGLNFKRWKIWTLLRTHLTVYNLKNTTCLQKHFKVTCIFQWLDLKHLVGVDITQSTKKKIFPKPYQVHVYNSYLHSVQLGQISIYNICVFLENTEFIFIWALETDRKASLLVRFTANANEFNFVYPPMWKSPKQLTNCTE